MSNTWSEHLISTQLNMLSLFKMYLDMFITYFFTLLQESINQILPRRNRVLQFVQSVHFVKKICDQFLTKLILAFLEVHTKYAKSLAKYWLST